MQADTGSTGAQFDDRIRPLRHCLFWLVRTVYIVVRSLIWRLQDYGTTFGAYETSANVEKIAWRSRFNCFDVMRPNMFLGVHEKFDHPECVLADDTILMSVSKTHAMFLRLPKSLWHYTADKTPFCWLILFKEAVGTVTMPLASLHRLADSMGPVKTPCLLISNEGRCGSTLLCSLMHYSNPKVLCLSEPDAFQCAKDMMIYRKSMGLKEYERLVKSVAILSFKPVTGAEAIVIKFRVTAMQIIKYVAKTCPEIKQIYLRRRDMLKTVQSWDKSFQEIGDLKILLFLARHNLMPFLMRHIFHVPEEASHTFETGYKYLNLKNPFEVICMPWSQNVLAYNDCNKDYPVPIVLFEDLLKKPEETLKKVFSYMTGNVQPTNLKAAVKEGLKADSQKGTPLSMSKLIHRKIVSYEPEVKKRVDAFLDAIGLPHLDE